MDTPLILTPSRQPAVDHTVAEVVPPSPSHSSITLAWHRSAVLLSANGLSLYEISRSLNRPVREIQTYLASPEAREHLSTINISRIAGSYEIDQLNAASQDAVLVLQTLMHSAASETVRLSAAKEILDRTLGKPSQNVVHSSKPKQKEEEEIASLRKELGLSDK
jgi:hypothetical protein